MGRAVDEERGLSGSDARANPCADLHFCHPWRPYQRRVLDELESHLADERLHIVAAPGSGKTTLGLEVFRRVAAPALILAPTRTIRDQWIARLRDFATEGGAPLEEWTSCDLSRPAFLTAVTYQALHTSYRVSDSELEEESEDADASAPDRSEIDAVVERLRETEIGLLVLDEAHHLRAEWWKALKHLVERIGSVQVVALTATPPYDAGNAEWNRYTELCGSIDSEISVPELVKSGTLCPHQDFVWAVRPSEKDVVSAKEYDATVKTLLSELGDDERFAADVAAHPWVRSAEPDPEGVFEDPELAVALAVFQKAKTTRPPRGLLKLLDCEMSELPQLDRRWWQAAPW